jgi:putative long chain acyl-CoA synthase
MARSVWDSRLHQLKEGWRNAGDLLRGRRLQEETFETPWVLMYESRTMRLRRYPSAEQRSSPLVLIPPLMLTAQVYDIAADLSAVAFLQSHGVDVWLVDFGAPEAQEHGTERTLDDHVRAVSEAVEIARRHTGRDVHLAGYSQGGMFAYQAAAFRRSGLVRSVITFGSPVDIRATVPRLFDGSAIDRMVRTTRNLLQSPLQQIDALPGYLTSTAFKLLSVRKEVQQFFETLALLHDRDALRQRESRRRFLAGEGFVAWPGPALRAFIDEFIVNNRMASGGFIIDGRTVTLADIDVPVLYFVGSRDELATPRAVRGIRQAAPRAGHHELMVRAGHFGLVVGRTAMQVTWPTVIEWIRWLDGEGQYPVRLTAPDAAREPVAEDIEEVALEDVEVDWGGLADAARAVGRRVVHGVEGLSREVTLAVDSLAYAVPRWARYRRLDASTRFGIGQALADQARALPDQVFFLHRGRAFRFREADRRVDAVVKGFWVCGIRPGDRVVVYMENRPSYLSAVAALNRLGAVAVLAGPEARRVSLERIEELTHPRAVLCDPERAAAVRARTARPVLVLGAAGEARHLPPDVVDMEDIDIDDVDLPPGEGMNPQRASDVCLIYFTAGAGGQVRAVPLTNRRWALAALGAAAACRLTTADTVYCAVPLYHPTAMLIAVGGALVGSARLALAERFEPQRWWEEVRRYGASVAVYAGDLGRLLVNQPTSRLESHSPLRLMAGMGMAPDVWERFRRRVPKAQILEYYASAGGTAWLVNQRGKPPGSVGRPLRDAAELRLVATCPHTGAILRDEDGFARAAQVDEPGLLVSEVSPRTRDATLEAFADLFVRDLFATGDCWCLTGDLLRVDAQGQWWYVDRLADVLFTASGPIHPAGIERHMEQRSGILDAVLLRRETLGLLSLELCIVVDAEGGPLRDELVAAWLQLKPTWMQPDFVQWTDRVDRTDTLRPARAAMAARLAAPLTDGWDGLWWDAERGALRRPDGRSHSRIRRQLSRRIQG